MLEKISLYILPSLIFIIFVSGLIKKVNFYEEFIDGAKDGFKIAINIIPYLVAIMIAVSMFKASGIFEYLTKISTNLLPVDVLPIMFTKSLSGSATLGVFSEIATKHGPDDFITKLSAIMVGSSETTFYVLSVYFGAVGIKKYRYALCVGLIADFIGILLSIFVARHFFLANM